jgi:3-hydroxyisobutyrate dehydrogenase-like beta-hydroxyacid dehydrogenase
VGDITIGLLHPGEMGAAVGQCLAGAGHQVLWAPEGRGAATSARAEAAGLTACELAEMVRRCDLIMSVCPPSAALDVARQVTGFGGIYLDANAISPATAREVAEIVGAGGASYVDGGIIGTPPVTPGFIRLYLSGLRAGEVRALFDGSPVDARVVDHELRSGAGAVGSGAGAVGSGAVGAMGAVGAVGAASAVKMAYASWTKGTAALLLAARALARAEGVEETLLAEWGISQPGLEARSAGAAGSAAAKGWRWIGEMEEIAATMAEVGLPEGFHQAAAEIYRRFQPADVAGSEAGLDALVRNSPDRSDLRDLLNRTIRVRALVQQGPRRSDR